MKKYLEFVGKDASRKSGTAEKFWEITQARETLQIRFGKIGSNGQTTVKSFPSSEAALKELDKLVAEKLRKGYVEIREISTPNVSKFCTQCGSRVSEGAKFCASCGARIEQVGNSALPPQATASPPKGGEAEKICAEVLETYSSIMMSDDFDPSNISENTFLGIAYAVLVSENAAIPTIEGLQVISSSKQSLIALEAELA